MNELARIEKWLYSYLSSDATLSAAVGSRFYGPKAKTGTAFPYITWNWQGASDVNGNAAARLMTKPLYQIKVVSKGLNDSVAAIADRLDELLMTSSELTSGRYQPFGKTRAADLIHRSRARPGNELSPFGWNLQILRTGRVRPLRR
jgi:hypothetical protein